MTIKRLGCGQSPVFLSGSPLFWFYRGFIVYIITTTIIIYKYLAVGTLLLLIINR